LHQLDLTVDRVHLGHDRTGRRSEVEPADGLVDRE
jgi:hypothetical protein